MFVLGLGPGFACTISRRKRHCIRLPLTVTGSFRVSGLLGLGVSQLAELGFRVRVLLSTLLKVLPRGSIGHEASQGYLACSPTSYT